jgi:hypothetical protein
MPACQLAEVALLRGTVWFMKKVLNKRGTVWNIKPVSFICTVDFSLYMFPAWGLG